MADRPLRIAMVAPPWYEVPPVGYGGIEQLVADLVRGLLARGNELTLIASGSDGTGAEFLGTFPKPFSDRVGEALPEATHAALTANLLRGLDVDLVHDHSLTGPLTVAERRSPTVVTVHNSVTGEFGDFYAALGDRAALVAISESQRSSRPELNWVATVHNAIDVADFPYQERKDDYVLFLGRTNPEKGTHIAIDACRRANRRLVIAAKCEEDLEKEYFAREIEPRLGPGVDYVGEVDAATKRKLLRNARCLLLPLMWEEPFGLVMIEALACGTPVVALRRGSVPEVLVDGRTGLVTNEPDGLPGLIDEVHLLDPADCRRDAERRFDLSVMAGKYEQMYRAVV